MVVADELIPAARTLWALLAAKSKSAIIPPGWNYLPPLVAGSVMIVETYKQEFSMNNLSVSFFRIVLSGVATLTIFLSAFLITLAIQMWAQEGVPPLENIKFVVMLFFVVIMLLTITLCLKIFMDIAVSSRNYKILIKRNSSDH
ncbi:MAG: hypothetical protein E7B97_07565 [Enterobacter sp.]|uniref:hypothetical protein n=1 Tax=Enterobacter TaxID=547 RepID=UPI001055E7AF|nr:MULTISPECIES: hypothetical protein [Enterobacter]QLW22037.1 hypothetical protein HV184_15215 [Enterobacter cloacae]ELI9006902.1 hypothetical protein [Enterobacter roggenkampii]MDU2767126.1 hypothetical protein [Enterobacter sp.]MDU2782266.1 hypothetical protein [Enterobacter sp.]MDU2840620.1 hypothetical protein [Enterobacter sp.]